MQDAVGMVDALEVVIHLGAERAAGERMRGITRERLGSAITDLNDPGTRIRTVVPAGAANDLDRSVRSEVLGTSS